MRFIWSDVQNRFVSPEERWAEKSQGIARSDYPSPQLIRDGMDATLNHADGKRYDSKRAYEKAVKAAGCEIVGNDPAFRIPAAPKYQPKGVADDLKHAIEAHGGVKV